MNQKLWGKASIAVLVAGLLAGCGIIQAAQGLKNDVLAQYASNGQPLNKAALEAKYREALYYGSTPASIGAPAQPSFSLASYPAQHTIEWGTTVPKGLTAWERAAATDAATWFMEYEGNHPLTIVPWGNPYEYFYLKGSTKKITGVQQQYLDIAEEINLGNPSSKINNRDSTHAYRTWSTITHVWTVPVKAYEQVKGITFSKPIEHLVATTVMIHQIDAWSGKYYYFPVWAGPASIYMVEMGNQWYYSSKTSWPQNNVVHQLPGSYVPHFPKTP